MGIVVLLEVRLIEVFRYPPGTKLTGIILFHRLGYLIETWLGSSVGAMEELCKDLTLENLVIMIHQWSEFTHRAEAILRSDLSSPNESAQALVRRGAKIYRCTGASKPDLGALRIILGGVPVPEVQQEPIHKGSESEQTTEPSKGKPELGERRNSHIRELGGNTEEALNKEIEELRRELEEQKRGAQQEADAFKKRIAEMVREHYQELEEQKRGAEEEADVFKTHAAEMVSREVEKQKRKAQEEADGLRKCIAELQSELEEDRHASGKTSATYIF